MSDNNINSTIGGFAYATKAVSEFFCLLSGVFENFKNFTLRIHNGQAELKDQWNMKRQVKTQCHQNTIKRMPLEQLIRTGFYPF
jgi:hypothetical protein